MKNPLIRLYQLQKLDSQEEDLNNDPFIKTLKEELGKLVGLISRKKQDLEILDGTIQKVNRLIKRKDDEEQIMGGRRKELEEEMYSGRIGAKELNQIQKKLNSLKGQKEKLTDEILSLLEEVEILEKEKEEQKDYLQRILDQRGLKEEELVHREKENEEKLKILLVQKEGLFKEIDEEMLNIYQEVKKNRGGKAVVTVKDSYCLGCRVGLPATIIDKLYSSNEIVYCESCRRILFLIKE